MPSTLPENKSPKREHVGPDESTPGGMLCALGMLKASYALERVAKNDNIPPEVLRVVPSE